MSEPRKYWIYNPNDRRGDWSVWLLSAVNGEPMNEDAIQVIEMSAYEQLKKERDELQEYNEVLRGELAEWNAELNIADDKITQLQSDRQTLLEALGKECTCADQNGEEIEKCNACKALAEVKRD